MSANILSSLPPLPASPTGGSIGKPWLVRLLQHYDYCADHRMVAALKTAKPTWQFESIPGGIGHKYNRRWFNLIGWPRQLLYGFIQGLRLIGRNRPPTIVTAYSHLVLLPIVLLRMVLPLRVHTVFHGFIYTHRQSPLLDWIRRHYFRALLPRLSLIICHSRYECDKYGEWFGTEPRFTYAPFCINVPTQTNSPAGDNVFSAGRSGRDYDLLLRAFSRLDVPLKIICDKFPPCKAPLPSNVEIMRHCYSADYLRVLAGAQMVVVPLAFDDISAGQMVLLQAMAMGKPVIVTATATTREYVTHGYNGWLIDRNDEQALCDAIHTIRNDPKLAAGLGENARDYYQHHHTLQSQASHFVRCLENLVEGEHQVPRRTSDATSMNSGKQAT